jgi:2-oxoglutarate ferredoxin oxidoreductase subunit alpha
MLNLGIVGKGGEGVVVLGGIILELAAKEGYFGQRTQYYGPQIRGGESAVIVSLDQKEILLPKDELDLLIVFDWQMYLRFREELIFDKKTMVLYEGEPPSQITLPEKSYEIPFSLARAKNLLALGLLGEILGFSFLKIKKLLKKLELKNIGDLDQGRELFKKIKIERLILPGVEPLPKVILLGNEAIARGAIRAGCLFCSFYPITPASEIMDYLARELPLVGGEFVQAEDEIAALGLTIGASLAGVKSIDVTSGPGFSLKTELLGLAIQNEIPLVLVNVQRAGPATGIPTKTEQSDLNQALYGGHGDCPRIVLGCWNLESCFRLTIEAFNLSEKYQVPVILLSDQWLSQTLYAQDPDFLKKNYPILNRKRSRKGPYFRYQLSSDLISPWADFGEKKSVHQLTGLSHDQRARPTTDPRLHQQMIKKRYQKLLPLKERKDLLKIFGNQNSKISILSWGSSAKAVLGAVQSLDLLGKVRVLIPEILYPLPAQLSKILESTNRLLIVEMSEHSQFYNYLRSQLDLPKNTLVFNRAGGKPFNLEELKIPLREVLK